MTETRTSYFELPQYSAGTDGTFTRADSNEAFANIESRAAYDDGAQGSALPSTLLKPGRYYKQTVSDGYALHRRNNSGGWDQVGGTVWSSRVRFRGALAADVVLSSDVAGTELGATLKASGELATPAVIRSSDVIAAGADLTADLSVPADTGRSYVRTRAVGDRALVLSAHDNAAGPLLSAQESGGTFPTTIDSRARLRSQVPAALGAASLTDNIPLGIAAGATDVTALDLYGRATGAVPALRAFRDLADADSILSVLPSTITLGRASWVGATVAVLAPTISLTGAVGVTGGVTASGAVAAAAAAITGTVTAQAGNVTTFVSGSNYGIRSQFVSSAGGALARDIRQSPVHRRRSVNIDFIITPTTEQQIFVTNFVPFSTCHADINLNLFFRIFGPGSSGQSVEPDTVVCRLRLLDQDDNVLFSGDQIYELTLGAYSSFNIRGRGIMPIVDCPPVQLTAGATYKIEVLGARHTDSAISPVLRHVIGTVREGVYV